MSALPRKVFIQIETAAEQQENIRNCRKTLKVLQKDAVNKENLVGRSLPPSKGIFKKSKSETAVVSTATNTDFKRKKSSLSTDSPVEKTLAEIIEEDLTTEGEPSEGYWKVLAEKRRVALDVSLKENEELHDKISNLEEELNISRAMLDESRNLVEVLTEMIQETEATDEVLKTDTESEGCSQEYQHDASLAEEAKESVNADGGDNRDILTDDQDDV